MSKRKVSIPEPASRAVAGMAWFFEKRPATNSKINLQKMLFYSLAIFR